MVHNQRNEQLLLGQQKKAYTHTKAHTHTHHPPTPTPRGNGRPAQPKIIFLKKRKNGDESLENEPLSELPLSSLQEGVPG